MDEQHQRAEQIKGIDASIDELNGKKRDLQALMKETLLGHMQSELAIYDAYVYCVDPFFTVTGVDIDALTMKVGTKLCYDACTIRVPCTDSFVHRDEAYVTMNNARYICSRSSIDAALGQLTDEALLRSRNQTECIDRRTLVYKQCAKPIDE